MVWYGGRELPFSQPGLPDTGFLDYLLGTDIHHHSLLCVTTVMGLEPTTLPSGKSFYEFGIISEQIITFSVSIMNNYHKQNKPIQF